MSPVGESNDLHEHVSKPEGWKPLKYGSHVFCLLGIICICIVAGGAFWYFFLR